TPRINWKFAIDTFLEGYHIPHLHRKTIAPYFVGNCGVFKSGGLNGRLSVPKTSIDSQRAVPEDARDYRQHVVSIYQLFPNPPLDPQRARRAGVSPRAKPPFRADQVGSLLRSAPVKQARTQRLAGEISPTDLKAVEDAEIKKLVRKQESIGLQAVTDGEFRRSWWHYDFLAKLDGVELVSVAQGLQFKGTQTKAEGLHVHGRIDFTSHPMIDHF